ncbi:MAG: ATP-binding protein [Pseudomonadota bacterium]|jgi:MinD superfamily P-loop ATPase
MGTAIAVASGKGGTGKTTVAVNMAMCCPSGTILLDCDVETPNAHLFFKPRSARKERVTVPKPAFDPEKCTGCGQCRTACRFNAIILLNGKPVLFPDQCHSCGGCARRCPADAIEEVPLEVGSFETGAVDELNFAFGLLDIGESRSSPVIERVRKEAAGRMLSVIDAPPGTSCPMVESVRDTNYAVLVTEPTPFGLHDLQLAVHTMRKMEIPFGVVINRADLGDCKVKAFCTEEKIPVLGEIPFDRRIAVSCSRGEVLSASLPEYSELFSSILERVLCEIEK